MQEQSDKPYNDWHEITTKVENQPINTKVGNKTAFRAVAIILGIIIGVTLGFGLLLFAASGFNFRGQAGLVVLSFLAAAELFVGGLILSGIRFARKNQDSKSRTIYNLVAAISVASAVILFFAPMMFSSGALHIAKFLILAYIALIIALIASLYIGKKYESLSLASILAMVIADVALVISLGYAKSTKNNYNALTMMVIPLAFAATFAAVYIFGSKVRLKNDLLSRSLILFPSAAAFALSLCLFLLNL